MNHHRCNSPKRKNTNTTQNTKQSVGAVTIVTTSYYQTNEEEHPYHAFSVPGIITHCRNPIGCNIKF
eukprot:m.309346 g.309346  ORF g.309346 m.309346 type:complete len:67 (+) comp390990_c0_seq1:22-222(+)